jgi:hypothetical protein
MTKFEALEAARAARKGFDPFAAPIVSLPVEKPRQYTGMRRTDFAVGKLYDDGGFVVVKTNMTREVAESVAGRMNDAASDEEVAGMIREKWTYAHRHMKGWAPNAALRALTKEQRSEKARKASDARWKNRPGFAGMTPEKRAEISAKANAARAAKLTPERRSEIAALANAARYGR